MARDLSTIPDVSIEWVAPRGEALRWAARNLTRWWYWILYALPLFSYLVFAGVYIFGSHPAPGVSRSDWRFIRWAVKEAYLAGQGTIWLNATFCAVFVGSVFLATLLVNRRTLAAGERWGIGLNAEFIRIDGPEAVALLDRSMVRYIRRRAGVLEIGMRKGVRRVYPAQLMEVFPDHAALRT